MKNLRNIIKDSIKKYLNENTQLIDTILDKINKQGKTNLSFDELTYLEQHSNNKVDPNLEKWLLSNHELTFDDNSNKLLYNEFEEDEDLFYNTSKLKRIISNHLNKQPFTNNADWGANPVWNIGNNIFLYLDLNDNQLVILKRTEIDGEYNDEIIKNITNSKELYNFFSKIKK